MLYIFWLLHQTTTECLPAFFLFCCISFDSYIKPQPLRCFVCPQSVVYLLTPTSNHNITTSLDEYKALYIFWLLHQTTTLTDIRKIAGRCISFDSYIKPQQGAAISRMLRVVYLLTPTSNHNRIAANPPRPTVVYLLTPTSNHNEPAHNRRCFCVVYLLTPTSNHNL